MRKLLLIIATTIAFNAEGQQHIVTYWDALKKFKHEAYDLNKNGEKNGKYTAYFLDGSINEENFYKDGMLNGKETLYYNDETGRGLAHVYNYVNARQDGLQQSYIEPSQGAYYFKYVRTEEFYKNGDIIWRKTYEIDNANKRCLRKEELFRDGSYQAYLTKGYTESGHQFYQIANDGLNFQEATARDNRIEFTAKDGKKDGLYREWYPNGHLVDSCVFAAGLPVGTEYLWYSNGKLKSIASFRNSKLDGELISYDTSGAKIRTVTYTNGEKQYGVDDIGNAINLYRKGNFHDGEEILEKIVTHFDIGYDSAIVIIQLCGSNGYAEKWIDWLMTKHSGELKPYDYITFSTGTRAFAMLDSGLQRFSNNPDLLYTYAHSLHSGGKDNLAQVYYQNFLDKVGNDGSKYREVEATSFLAQYSVRSLGSPASNPSICGSQTATETLQKINLYIDALKKLGADSDDIKTIESNRDAFLEDCKYYGQLNRGQPAKKKASWGDLFKH